MKNLILVTSLFLSQVSFAAIELREGQWHYGEARQAVIKTVGISTDDQGVRQVVLNLENGQMILSGEHLNLGLSLMSFQGKCIKIIPGQYLKSANIILACQ